jgi:alpha 1,3-glucosidase
MIGDAVLVIPILEERAERMDVRLPEAVWYEYRSRKRVAYGFDCDVSDGRPLVFIRGGKVLPFWRKVEKCAGLMLRNGLSLIVALNEANRAEGEVYLDDGESFGYKNGEFVDKWIVMENGVLVSNDKEVGKGFEGSDGIEIEEIEILGFGGDVCGVRDGADQMVDFEKVDDSIVIRPRGLHLRTDWRLELVCSPDDMT